MLVVFLDIDGVLNCHDFDVGSQSNRIQYRCIRQLNRIIKATGCNFVLSSAWRYMLLKRPGYKPAMTLQGFEYMMRTHGTCGFRLLGTTCSDEEIGWKPDPNNNLPVRGLQITRWLKENGDGIKRYIAIDDEDWGITEQGHRLVRTQSRWGLSERTCREAIRELTKSQ